MCSELNLNFFVVLLLSFENQGCVTQGTSLIRQPCLGEYSLLDECQLVQSKIMETKKEETYSNPNLIKEDFSILALFIKISMRGA